MTRWLFLLLLPATAEAVTSTKVVTSPFSSNGHNVSFDGRLFIGQPGPGWTARLLLPQNVTYDEGFPNVSNAFSPSKLLQPTTDAGENALGLCEETPQPVACNEDGTANSTGTFACYNLVVFNSDLGPPEAVMKRRKLQVIVANPGTAQATIADFSWPEPPQQVTPLESGIEPTFTKDGKLMIWNGTADDNGVGGLVYAFNSTPCAKDGWSEAKQIAALNTDPLVQAYPLAAKPLRSPDGEILSPSTPIVGAYPWLFPSGEAVNFTAANMPCRVVDSPVGCGVSGAPKCITHADPPGCGPVRNALSVIGYPTNWTLAHIDGAVNPDTDQTCRLFFTSPQPLNATPLPATKGKDVWPFFGSNTANYTELIFDDGLDGQYGGLWHLNEYIGRNAQFDYSRTPDSSGYFNTGSFPYPRTPNTGLLGTTQSFDGTTQTIDIPNSPALEPTGIITVTVSINLADDPDCDGNNNYRLLVQKGTGSYSLVLEEPRGINWRLQTEAGQYGVYSFAAIPIGRWITVTGTYDATTGRMRVLFDGVEVAAQSYSPSPIVHNGQTLTVGGAPGTQPACPVGGDFHGQLDNLSISGEAPPAVVRMFPAKNNGVLGKAVVFDGSRHMEVAHAQSLTPVNALTVEAAVNLSTDPDCDGNDNFRLIVAKGDVPTGSYSLVLEEDRHVRGRVRVTGGAVYTVRTANPVSLGTWTKLGMTYDAQSGDLAFWVDGKKEPTVSNAPALLEGLSDVLTVGGPVLPAAACPNGSGGFQGTIDEVAVSSVVRDFTPPKEPTLPPPAAAGDTPVATKKKSGCSSGSPSSLVAAVVIALVFVGRRKRDARIERRKRAG